MGSPAPLSMYGATIWPAPATSPVVPVVNPDYQDGEVMFAINSYGQIAYPPALTTFFTGSRIPAAPAAAPAAAPDAKRAYTHLDLDSSSDDEHHHAPHRDYVDPVTPTAKGKGSESDDSSSVGTDDEDEAEKAPAKKMARISKEERDVVCTWIQKTRPDGRMNNGRWARNGGAKGATMTATSGEVKTSGAQDALAA